MVSSFKQETIRFLLHDAKSQKIQLPSFQRSFVWKIKDQQDLASSLISEIPIGSLLFLKGNFGEFGSRDVGCIAQNQNGQGDTDFLLDGQQRLSTLQAILSDRFGGKEWDKVLMETSHNLRHRWTLDVGVREQEEDPFGLNSLMFEGLKLDLEATSVRFKAHKIVKKTYVADPTSAPWYHPAKSATFNTQQELLLDVAKSAASKQQIPLWELMEKPESDRGSLHSKTLDLIAREKVDFLNARIEGNSLEPGVMAALQEINPGLKSNPGKPELQAAVSDLAAQWKVEIRKLLEILVNTTLPFITLPKEEIDRAIEVYQAMNLGGQKLTIFDLLTAKLVRHNPNTNLTQNLVDEIQNWDCEVSEDLWGDNLEPDKKPDTWRAVDNNNPLRRSFGVEKDDLTSNFKSRFSQVISILGGLESGQQLNVEMLSEKAVLAISGEDLGQFKSVAAAAILRAWQFLQLRCGIRSEGDLRNQLLLVPLAILLRNQDAFADKSRLSRLEYWYWSSVLTNTYNQRQKENAVGDTKSLIDWIEEGKANPFTGRRQRVLQDESYSDKNYLVGNSDEVSVGTDVGDYLAQYVISRSPYDFYPKENPSRMRAWEGVLQLHHIVPLGTATTVGESTRKLRNSPDQRVLNSPLNFVLISQNANSKIGAMHPAQYFESVSDAARNSNFADKMSKMDAHYTDSQLSALLEDRYDKILLSLNNELDTLA